MAEEPADITEVPAATDAVPTSTEAVQAVQRTAWIRGISLFIGVCVLLVLLGWIAGSIANSLAESPSDRALAELAAAGDRDAVSADAPDGVEATLAWSRTLGTAAITASGLPALSGGEAFVVWYVADDGHRHVADFTATDGSASLLLDDLWQPGETVIVSVDVPDEIDAAVGEVAPEPLLTFATPAAP